MIKDELDDPEAELRKRLAGQIDPGIMEGDDPGPLAPPPPPPAPEAQPKVPTEPLPIQQAPLPQAPQTPPYVPSTETPPYVPETFGPKGAPPSDTPPPAPAPQPTPAPGPTPSPPPGSPAPSGTPTPSGPQSGVSNLSPHASWIAGIFKEQGKTPTAEDIAYWEAAIGRANGDLGYIRMRMLQPDTGQQQGAAPPTGQLNYQQQLDYLKSKLGSALTPDELAKVRARFGGTEHDTADRAMLDSVAAYVSSLRGTGGIHPPGPTGPTIDGPGGTNGPGGTPTGPQGLWGPAFLEQVRKMLMERLKGASGPVDENDPTINASLTAARNEMTRSSDKERTDLAEHLYAEGSGLNTDAISQKIQQSGERNAMGLGSLRANLMQKEIEGRRSELQNLMQLALQSGDAEMTNAIRLQLAALDAQLRREGYGVDMAKYQAYLNALAGQHLTNQGA